MTQGAQIVDMLENVLAEKQDDMLEVLTKRIDDIEKREEKFEKSIKRELIRQEFKSAIESESVTERELFDIYEQYKELGLTEYDKRRMEQYLEQKDARGER